MAKEEDLKVINLLSLSIITSSDNEKIVAHVRMDSLFVHQKIELKVSVDCCDGCKKKVLKALSIKGVLKMEIHPSKPLVTVTGNVDAQTLIKRLAKYGKLAEVLPVDEKKQEKGDKKAEKMEGCSKDKASDGKSDKKVAFEQEKSSKCCEATKSKQREKKVDDEKVDKVAKVAESGSENTSEGQTEGAFKSMNPVTTTTTTTTANAAVSAPLPQLNYMVSPGMMQGAVFAQASVPRVYYPMEQYMVPVPYTMANTLPPANTYPAQPTMTPVNAYPQNMYPGAATLVPQPYYCCHDPHHHHSSVQPLPPRLTDYFNDDNTSSCSIM